MCAQAADLVPKRWSRMLAQLAGIPHSQSSYFPKLLICLALILNILLYFQPMGVVISPDFYLENMVTKFLGLSHQIGSSLKAGVGSQ